MVPLDQPLVDLLGEVKNWEQGMMYCIFLYEIVNEKTSESSRNQSGSMHLQAVRLQSHTFSAQDVFVSLHLFASEKVGRALLSVDVCGNETYDNFSSRSFPYVRLELFPTLTLKETQIVFVLPFSHLNLRNNEYEG